MTARLVVLASGHGSNLQAVLDACADGRIDAGVHAVFSDRADAYALDRAESAGVDAVRIPKHADETRTGYDARLAGAVAAFTPDWVVLAGWMRLLTMNFLGCFPERVINLHPALPGEFVGLHAIEQAWRSGRARTGVMVHLVPDEGVDDGPVLATVTVPIQPRESLEALTLRVHAAEHELLITTLARLCDPRDPYRPTDLTTPPPLSDPPPPSDPSTPTPPIDREPKHA